MLTVVHVWRFCIAESGDLIWRKNFLGDSSIYPTDFSPPCYGIAPEWGITSTPYIKRDSNTLYVVPWTKEGGILYTGAVVKSSATLKHF